MGRREKLVAFYGSEEAYRQHQREIRAKLINVRGGFSDPDTAREAQKLSTKAKLERKRIEEAHARKDS